MSESRRSRKHSPETRQKMREARLGRKHSPETRAKISAARRAKADKFVPVKHRVKISASRRRRLLGLEPETGTS